jgi:hypothetical protein
VLAYSSTNAQSVLTFSNDEPFSVPTVHTQIIAFDIAITDNSTCSSVPTVTGYQASIFDGVKDVDGSETVAEGVQAFRIKNVVGAGTITLTVDGVDLSPVFDTSSDTERVWESIGSTISWASSAGITEFQLGQGRFI